MSEESEQPEATPAASQVTEPAGGESDASQEPRAESASTVRETAGAMGRTILSYIDRGVEASKKGLRSAGSAISDFGDKSVLRIELSQLKAKKNKALAELGAKAYAAFSGGSESFPADEAARALVDTLSKLDENIRTHEASLGEGAKSPAEGK